MLDVQLREIGTSARLSVDAPILLERFPSLEFSYLPEWLTACVIGERFKMIHISCAVCFSQPCLSYGRAAAFYEDGKWRNNEGDNEGNEDNEQHLRTRGSGNIPDWELGLSV